MAPPLTLNGWLSYDTVERLLSRLDGIESVLEIGSGEGAVAWRLARRYLYVGLEPDLTSFAKALDRLAAIPSARLLNAGLEGLGADEVFDLVCAFEVLEHIEDDRAALTEWRLRVRPGGWLIVSVPAWPRRWGAADEKAGHYRRYEPDELRELLRRAGFDESEVLLYGFPLGYVLQPLWNRAARPAIARGASMEERTASSGRWFQPPEALGFITQAVAAPFRLLQRPFARSRGTGLVAIARLPAES